MSSMPWAETFLVLPKGPPMLAMAAWCLSAHAFQAAMPCCSLALRSASGRANQAFALALSLLPRKTARNKLVWVIWVPFLSRRWGRQLRIKDDGGPRHPTTEKELFL